MWRHSPHHTHARGGEISDLWPLTVSRFALFFAILHVSCDAANALLCHVLHEFDKY